MRLAHLSAVLLVLFPCVFLARAEEHKFSPLFPKDGVPDGATVVGVPARVLGPRPAEDADASQEESS